MQKPLRGRALWVMVGAIAALQWTLTAQSPAAKRPLSYDVMDSWKSIQGTELSQDGQWLAYATSAPGDDGELVVRNLRTGQEFKHARHQPADHARRKVRRLHHRAAESRRRARGAGERERDGRTGGRARAGRPGTRRPQWTQSRAAHRHGHHDPA